MSWTVAMAALIFVESTLALTVLYAASSAGMLMRVMF